MAQDNKDKVCCIFMVFLIINFYPSGVARISRIIIATPEGCKFIIKKTHENTTNLIIHDHHVIKGLRALTLDKLILFRKQNVTMAFQ